MAGQSNSHKGITSDTRRLLNGLESLTVELKENVDGVKPDDLVAFANRKEGGTIFAGVKDNKHWDDPKAFLVEYLVEQRLTDRAKRQLLEKAMSCIPPVQMQLSEENTAKISFIRIDVLPSKSWPHCTSSGKYVIREDGLNHALQPNQLLGMFLDREEGSFLSRYRAATDRFEQLFTNLEFNVESNLHDLNIELERSIEELSGRIGDAFESSEGAFSFSVDIKTDIQGLRDSTERLDEIASLLLKHFGIEDPFITRMKLIMRTVVYDFIKLSPDQTLKELRIKVRKCFPSVDEKLFEEVFQTVYLQAREMVAENQTDKKAKRRPSKPKAQIQ